MSLSPILGVVLDALPVELTWERDLEYFEGPVMALYRSPQGEPYVETWIDGDESVSRWLLFRITELELIRYLFRKLTLRTLILGARDGFVFVLDRSSEKPERILFVRVERVPADVLPADESFHVATGEELEANEQAILLGEAHYEPDDLAHLRRVYAQVYSFRSAMAPDTQLTVPLKGTFKHYTFAGGFVYNNALVKIEQRLAPADRPKMLELRVASPGFMRLRVNPTLADLTKQALAHLQENHESIRGAYDRVQGMIREHKRAAKEHGHKWVGLASIEEPIPAAVNALLAKFDYLDAQKIWNAGGSAVNTAALVTTYFRRLNELLQNSTSGAAEIL